MTRPQRTLLALSILAFSVFGGLTPRAEAVRFELDPKKTSITFGFGATLHSVQGFLSVREGRIELAPDGGATGEIVIDMKSAQTGISRRDRKMHGKILETDRYPDAIFTIDRMDGHVNRVGASEIQLHGTLEIHGSTHRVSVPARLKSDGSAVSGNATLSIPYVEWGFDDPSFFVLRVDKIVEVNIKVSGTLVE